MNATAPANYEGVHNVVLYHDNFLAGGVPEGDAGFETLHRLGIRTVISVDGSAPDVARAKAHGLRYIHLPIGYNGFDESRKLELVRATRDAMNDGPVYLHCHHGKHRAAGAAAAVAASLGWLTPQEAVAKMKVSGTAPGYVGLYSCASTATLLDASVINAVPADFPESTPPKGFRLAMVEADETLDHLKLIEKAKWTVPADHPDLVPAAEAGRLADLMRTLADSGRAKSREPRYAEMLRVSGRLAQELEDALAHRVNDHAALSATITKLNASCTGCHVTFRDADHP
jgi:protein tyrosine phosphatase (PTP) superfamily phosphohydrolase (DUF442 family)